jgi:hypothetical protein
MPMAIQQIIRNSTLYIIVIAAFGVLVPIAKGLGFLDTGLLSAYACLGIVFAGPAAAQAFEQKPASLREAVRWIVKAVLFGEGIALATLACGLATVYLRNRAAFFPPDLESLAYAVLLGCAGSAALASLAAWSALWFSAAAARMIMRLVFLGLLVLFYLRGRWLPTIYLSGTIYCLALTALFLILLRRRLA